jgi:hypothetical protein
MEFDEVEEGEDFQGSVLPRVTILNKNDTSEWART